MKKIYVTLLSAMIACGVNAQTMTQANSVLAVGDMATTKQCDSTTINPGGNGANQVWNFSSLTIHNSVVTNYTGVTPASTGSATSYPSANVAVQQATGNNSFYDSNSSYLKYWGGNLNIGTVNVLFAYTTPAIYETFPFGLSSTSTNSVAGTLTVSSNSGNFTGTCTSTGLGTGTINLPGGSTVTNVLKMSISQALTFTVSSFITGTVSETRYNYYSSTQKWPVFSILTQTVTSPLGNSTQTFVAVNSALVLGVNEASNEIGNFVVYPNPAKSNLNITFNNANGDAASCEILNAIGQTVKTESFGTEKGISTQNLAIENLPSGFYFVKVNVGNKTKIQKITVQ